MKRQILLFSGVFVLLLATIGCSSTDAESQEATAQALGEAIFLTATAAAEGAFDSAANQATAEAAATALSEAAAATQAAQNAADQQVQAVTATAVAPILAELPSYDVNPSAGRVGWIHPPLELYTEGYMQYSPSISAARNSPVDTSTRERP